MLCAGFMYVLLPWPQSLIWFDTHSLMELSPSWEGANCAVTQELPSVLWNPKVHYPIYKSPPLVPILSQIDPIPTIPSYLSKGLWQARDISQIKPLWGTTSAMGAPFWTSYCGSLQVAAATSAYQWGIFNQNIASYYNSQLKLWSDVTWGHLCYIFITVFFLLSSLL
jgi:hypothetical protein